MPTTNAPAALSYFLGDFDAAQFLAGHWEQRSLHLPHGDPARFSHLISPQRLLETEVRRCRHLKASTRDREGWNVETAIQPEQAPKMFRSGLTICASLLDEAGPVGEVIEAFRGAFTSAAPPHVNCYYSPDQQGYGLHFDTHPVWILQVEGRKHWTVGRTPAVRNPPFNVIFPPGRDHVELPWIALDRPDVSDPERFMQIRLDPGDVLYMPAGCWHAARAEGPSLALTLALGRVGTFDIFDFLLTQTAHRRLRETTSRLPPVPRPGLPGHAVQRADLLARLEADLSVLKQLVQRIDAEALLQLYAFHAEHPETMLATREPATARGQVESMRALFSGGGAPRRPGVLVPSA